MTAIALLLCCGAAATPDLAFPQGELLGWDGSGFRARSLTGGPSLHWGVQSGDAGVSGRTGLLYRTFPLPTDAEAIVFQAAVMRPAHLADVGKIDILLELPGGIHCSRQGGRPLPRWEPGPLPEARISVAEHAGKTVRLLLIDQDDRPDCGLVCAGFRLVRRATLAQVAPPEERQFVRDLLALGHRKNLPPLTRLDSRHFVVVGNASDELLELMLFHGEAIYPEFLAHFRARGFAVKPPAGKLQMVAFESQTGFEAYLGRRMPDNVTGIYHPGSNRLVVYDFARNRTFSTQRAGIESNLLERQRLQPSLEQARQLGQFRSSASDFRATMNTSTVMHEMAHQLAFNCGLLNRQGDTPAWLVEGMAVYFESTINGNWQGSGEPNQARATTLAQGIQTGQLLTLREMISEDNWLAQGSREQILLGYSQGWALFRLLMRDRPRALRRYLELIHGRRTADHRWTDFAECFGPDVGPLERAYRDYLRELALQEGER